MVTKVLGDKCYQLRFVNVEGQDIYQAVTSRDLDTLRYAVRNMMKRTDWILKEFHEVWIWRGIVCVTKFAVSYRETDASSKMYFHAISQCTCPSLNPGDHLSNAMYEFFNHL